MATAIRLYREYLRGVRRLPVLYLRQFWAVRARIDIENIISTAEPGLRARKTKGIKRRVRRVHSAGTGHVKDFAHILDHAYGRAGKLRWDLLDSIVEDPTAAPKLLIPGVARSAVPSYSPELATLLTTSIPRTKALSPAELAKPRTLPPTVDPDHPDTALRGPLSKRREVNIRRKAYANALRRVAAPLELAVRPADAAEPTTPSAAEIEALRAERGEYPRPLAMQDLGLMKGIEDITGGSIFPQRVLTRRERRGQFSARAPAPEVVGDADSAAVAAVEEEPHPTRHPLRWVRRAYRVLLSAMPHLVYDGKTGKYTAGVSPLALTVNHRATHYNPPIDDVSRAWLGDEDLLGGKKKKGSKKGEKAD